MPAPHRAVTLELKMDADDRHELAIALRNFAFDVEFGGAKNGVCGGVSSGYSWRVEDHGGPTAEQYHEQVRELLGKGEGGL